MKKDMGSLVGFAAYVLGYWTVVASGLAFLAMVVR